MSIENHRKNCEKLCACSTKSVLRHSVLQLHLFAKYASTLPVVFENSYYCLAVSEPCPLPRPQPIPPTMAIEQSL